MGILNARDFQAPSASDLAPSEPVVLGSFTGVYQAPSGPVRRAMLMLSPIGFEELCARAFWTTLADRLAAVGIATLRFDYPGTANALDTHPEGIADWRAAAVTAAQVLRGRTGAPALTLLGQGLGASFALAWAEALGPLDAAVLIEPAMTGRAYLRGLKAWGVAVAAAAGTGADPADPNGHGVAGLVLPDARLDAIRALNLGQIRTAPVPAAFLLEQPGGFAGKALAEHLLSLGVAVDRRDCPDYAALLTDPTSAVVPEGAIGAIVDWLAQRPIGSPPHPPLQTQGIEAQAENTLEGDGFTETPVRFGPGQRLAGVLCRPVREAPHRPALVIANAGRDYHMGWGRATVGQARSLARAGIATIRFDIGGVGDSRAAADAPAEILYSLHMCDDLRAAIDHLDDAGYRSLGLLGRCSGAWAAFTVAAEDPRIRSVALINTGYFLWDPSKNLAEVIRFAQRSLGDLGHTLLRRDGLRRLLKGELDLRGAWRFLKRQANRALLRRNAALLGRLTAESRRYHDLHAIFGRLRAREVRMLLVYADNDSSIEELRSFMGSTLRTLKRYPNVGVHHVVGADHNFTHQAARESLGEALLGFFRAETGATRPVPETAPVTAARIDYGILTQNG